MDPNPFRRWTWRVIGTLSNSEVVNSKFITPDLFWLKTFDWSSRKIRQISADNGNYSCYSSVDFTDCPIQEIKPFDASWCSHKTNSACLCYELSISIYGKIIWINGPFQPNPKFYLIIFRQKTNHFLENNELIAADTTYVDVSCVYDDGFSVYLVQKIRAG